MKFKYFILICLISGDSFVNARSNFEQCFFQIYKEEEITGHHVKRPNEEQNCINKFCLASNNPQKDKYINCEKNNSACHQCYDGCTREYTHCMQFSSETQDCGRTSINCQEHCDNLDACKKSESCNKYCL